MKKVESSNTYSITKWDWTLLSILAVAYYFMIRQYIYSVDDVMYTYIRTANGIDWSHRISSFAEAVASQKIDYFIRNGRVETHTLVQYFCGMSWGRQVFFVISSVMFSTLLAGIIKSIRYLNKGRCQSLLAFVILMLLVPIPGRTFMGNMAFTMNYLWSSAATVWIIYFFLRLKDSDQYNRAQYSAILLLAVIVGAMHEGFSLPVSGMMFFYLCFNYKKCNKRLLIFIIAYWVGTLLEVTAPANFFRAETADFAVGYGQPYLKKVFDITFGFIKGEILVQLFALMSLAGIILHKRVRDFISAYWYYALVGLLVICFDVFVVYIGVHQMTPLSVILTIIFAGAISRVIVFKVKGLVYATNIILMAIVIVAYCTILTFRCQLRQTWDEMHQEIAKPQVDYANACKVFNVMRSMPISIRNYEPIHDLMLHTCNKHYFETLSSIIATNGSDENKITTVLPDSKEAIIAMCSDDNSVSDHIYRGEDYCIIRTPIAYDTAKACVKYIYHPGFIGKILRKFGRNGTIQTMSLPNQSHLFIANNERYAIIYINSDSIEKIWLEKN